MNTYKEEELTFIINKKKIKVFNSFDEETGKYIKDQHNGNGIEEIKSMIKDELDKGEVEGYYPYNNFESRLSWRIENNKVTTNPALSPQIDDDTEFQFKSPDLFRM